MSSNETDAFDTLMNEHTGGQTEVKEESSGTDTPASEEVDTQELETETESEAPADDEDGNDDGEAESEEDAEADEPVEEAPKGKKKSAQERIAEVVAKQRQAEREAAKERSEKEELHRRLQDLEAKLNVNPQRVDAPNPANPVANEFGLVEPTENDLDANGEPKYPLGSFDPLFMRDITRFDRAVEKAYEARVNAEAQRQAQAQAEEQKLINDWDVRLTEAEKTSPKIRDKAQLLVDALDDSDPQHMQVLAQTIMTLDNGPSVLEYLADNLDEANKISRLPTNKALLQLGRLDGLFVSNDDEPEDMPVKTTNAPAPAKLARGSGGGKGGAPSLYDRMLKDFR